MFAKSKQNLSLLLLSCFVVQFVIHSQAESITSSEDKHREVILQTGHSIINSETFSTAEESSREIIAEIEESTATSSNNLVDGSSFDILFV